MAWRLMALSALCFFILASMGLAQNAQPYDRSTGAPAATAPNDNASGILPPATGPRKPGAQEARPRYPSNPLNYPSSSLNYQSSEEKLRTRQIDPNRAAAQQQSGLNQAEATDLMSTQGYTRVGTVRADPNSIWVWQADAMKNGRPVHLGIDYRGNLLEIQNGPAQPCRTPGAGFGPGPIGVGSRLSEVTGCSPK